MYRYKSFCSQHFPAMEKSSFFMFLMLWTYEVVYCFNWVEGRKWHFHKYGIPIAHGAIPKSWKFQRLKFFAILALL